MAFVSLGLPDTILGVAWPSLRRSFGLPLDRLGVLLAAIMVGYLASSLASGAVVRRLRVGGLLVASSVLIVLSSIGYTLAPAWPVVVACGLVAGLGAGAIDSGINAFAAAHFSAGRVAWLHAAWGVGATLGPLLMTAVLAAGLEWRAGYALLAVIISALALGFQRTRGLWNDEGTGAAAVSAPVASLRASLGQPGVRANVALFFLYTGLEATPGHWAYTLLTEGRGLAPALAGVAVSAYWGSLTVGRLVSGMVTHRYPPAFVLRLCLAGLPLAALVVASAREGPFLLLGLALLGLLGASVFPLLIAGTPSRVGVAHASNSVGFQVGAATLGGALVPSITGVLARLLGVEAIAAVLVSVALGVLVLHELVLRRERADVG
jgi:fucose permease